MISHIYSNAVAQLPSNQQTYFALLPLGLPQAFGSEEALERATSGKEPREYSYLISELVKVLGQDTALYKLALDQLHHAQREDIDRVGCWLCQNEQRAGRVQLRTCQETNAEQWQRVLKYRTRALDCATDAEKDAYNTKVMKDKEHAVKRFFPARASAWVKNRNVKMPSA